MLFSKAPEIFFLNLWLKQESRPQEKQESKIFSIFIFLKQKIRSFRYNQSIFRCMSFFRSSFLGGLNLRKFFRNNLATFHPSSSFSLTLFPLSSTFPSLEIFSQSFLYLHNLYNIQFLHNSNLPQKKTL